MQSSAPSLSCMAARKIRWDLWWQPPFLAVALSDYEQQDMKSNCQ